VNIILIGPPGSGKGTQASNIVNTFNLHKISTGDLLREEINKNTELGLKIKSLIDKGMLAPDNVIADLVTNILSNKKLSNKLIFDGYPRNLNQAKNLDFLIKKFDQTLSCVLSLNVEKDLLIKRILGRQTCTKCGSTFNEHYKPSTSENHSCGTKFLIKRSDDNNETIAHRFETYFEKTLPILDYYKKIGLLHEINGNTEIDQIFKEIRAIIAPLEA
jgi:adenylate kinase|tara:strand:- start:21 stop:671 length:651 start_codon:yes stop_codon:yes gene_type:complete